MTRADAWAVVALACLASVVEAGPRQRCRRACRDEVRACVAVVHRPRACRRRMMRACLREGIAVCLETGATTTTTSTVPSGPTSTTTSTTLPLALRVVLGVFEQPYGEQASVRVSVYVDRVLFQLTPTTRRYFWCDVGLELVQVGRVARVSADGSEARITYLSGSPCGDVPNGATVTAEITQLPAWFVFAKRFFVHHGDDRLLVP